MNPVQPSSAESRSEAKPTDVAAGLECHVLTADLSLMRFYRTKLDEWLCERSPNSDVRHHEILLVFTELLANAVKASQPAATISISWSRGRNSTTLRCVNSNPRSTAVELRTMPEPLSESGRGLAIAELHASRLEIHSAGGTVDISAVFEDDT